MRPRGASTVVKIKERGVGVVKALQFTAANTANAANARTINRVRTYI
jgi:hypothetical protein